MAAKYCKIKSIFRKTREMCDLFTIYKMTALNSRKNLYTFFKSILALNSAKLSQFCEEQAIIERKRPNIGSKLKIEIDKVYYIILES